MSASSTTGASNGPAGTSAKHEQTREPANEPTNDTEAVRRLREVLEWTLDAAVVVDGEGTITLMNAAAERLLGYSRDELAGVSVDCLVPEGSRLAHGVHRAGFGESPSSGPMGSGRELYARRKDGTLIPVEVTLNPIAVSGKSQVSCLIRDLTERRRTEAEVARYTRELERSNRELEQFAYVASHDLLEPLRMVTSFTRLLAKRYRGKLGPDADEFIGHALNGAHRMQELIRDLLKYSRVGTRGAALDAVSLEEVLDGVLDDLRLVLEESGASVTREPLPWVNGDRSQLGQLFQNLIANAIKFRSRLPPRIHVASLLDGGSWVLRVSDNGIGIPDEHGESVFEIFRRLHKRDDYPGTGIGLAICKRIVEHHGGRIWLESLPAGTTIVFTMPTGHGRTHERNAADSGSS
jgi:PAS domain S-box-containing protein